MREDVSRQLSAVIAELFDLEVNPVLTRPEAKFGDFATNVALQLTGTLQKPPREIADAIAGKLGELEGIAEASVAGPGFINVRLSEAAWRAALENLLTNEEREGATGTAVIETNNPNPFKAMHIGHAFNAIIADTIANLIEARGVKTHRVSYHGDVGSHVGKSMWAILRFIDGDVSKLETVPAEERNAFMSARYVEGAAAYKDSEAAKREIDALAEQSFTLEDPLFRQVYEICKGWSFEALDATVARLGNQPIERRYLESQADARGVETVRAHVGDVFRESDGALIFDGEDYGTFTNVFVSSKGRGLYAARDLGLMQLKHEDFKADKSYIVTGEEQRDYFRGVIKAAELCLPELAGVTTNITTGMVKLSTGKMSSREGNVLDIAWLFSAIEEAVRARGAEPTDETLQGALRYQFLKARIGSDVIFDIDEAVSVQGNSGPYLQYAHARACSILRKAGTEQMIGDLDDAERAFVVKLTEFSEVKERALTELLPHLLCTYLYELAQTFNRFYEHNRIIGDEREAVRLALVAAYVRTLASGLKLLGIPAPEKM